MVQQRAYGNEVIRRIRQFVLHDVELADLQIASGNSSHQIGANVCSDYMPARSDTLGEPL
jgi:hypothetical protein